MMHHFSEFINSLRTKRYYDNSFPHYKEFIHNTKSFWTSHFQQPSNANGYIISMIPSVVHTAVGGFFFTHLLSKQRSLKVLYLAYNNNNLMYLRHAFPHGIVINFDNLKLEFNDQAGKDAFSLFKCLREPKDILDLEYKELYIGNIVYDLAMRKGFWQGTVWRIDERVLETIKDCILHILILDDIRKKYDIRAAYALEWVGWEGLFLRYWAGTGIESYMGGPGMGNMSKCCSFQGKVLSGSSMIPSDIFRDLIENAETREMLLKKANAYLERRFSGTQVDDKTGSRLAYDKKRIIYESKDKFCDEFSLDKSKPLVFIMLHAFNDHPHHYEKNLFVDYYQWFIQTLKRARKITSVNWIFKEHPYSQYYPDDINLSGIFDVLDDKHILFLDNTIPFNTFSLRYIAHAQVTCIGSSGLEFICFGIPCVLAGENHYSGLGMACEPSTLDEYWDILNNINKISDYIKLNQEKQELAKIRLYLQNNFFYAKTEFNSPFIPEATQDDMINANEPEFLKFVADHLRSKETEAHINKVAAFISNNHQKTLLTKEDLLT